MYEMIEAEVAALRAEADMLFDAAVAEAADGRDEEDHVVVHGYDLDPLQHTPASFAVTEVPVDQIAAYRGARYRLLMGAVYVVDYRVHPSELDLEPPPVPLHGSAFAPLPGEKSLRRFLDLYPYEHRHPDYSPGDPVKRYSTEAPPVWYGLHDDFGSVYVVVNFAPAGAYGSGSYALCTDKTLTACVSAIGAWRYDRLAEARGYGSFGSIRVVCVAKRYGGENGPWHGLPCGDLVVQPPKVRGDRPESSAEWEWVPEEGPVTGPTMRARPAPRLYEAAPSPVPVLRSAPPEKSASSAPFDLDVFEDDGFVWFRVAEGSVRVGSETVRVPTAVVSALEGAHLLCVVVTRAGDSVSAEVRLVPADGLAAAQSGSSAVVVLYSVDGSVALVDYRTGVSSGSWRTLW